MGVRLVECVRQGALWAKPLTLTDSDGDPIDLTGSTFLGHVRASEDPDEALLFAITLSVVDATSGRLDMIIEGSKTAQLAAGVRHYFDVFMNGDRPLLFGTITAAQRITRP
jgi:hypothetical protein